MFCSVAKKSLMGFAMVAVSFLGTIAHAQSAGSYGFKGRLEVKIFDGPSVMMPNERNLTELQECDLAFDTAGAPSGPVSIGSCTGPIQDLDRVFKSGTYEVFMNAANRHEARFNVSLKANGLFGGGQDGPFFATGFPMVPGETREIVFNLGFHSRTPEIAYEYLMRVRLLSLQYCESRPCD